MAHHRYETMDPEEQVQPQDNAPYNFYLQLWTPSGREHYALTRYSIIDEVFTGFGKENDITVSFPAAFAWIIIDRRLLIPRTEEEAFEAHLEYAQAQQMREDRAKSILVKKDPNSDAGYR